MGRGQVGFDADRRLPRRACPGPAAFMPMSGGATGSFLKTSTKTTAENYLYALPMMFVGACQPAR
jgi:hypothetical protein